MVDKETGREFSSATLVKELRITPREAEVLIHVAAGLTNRQVAHRMSISEGTVIKHLEKLYRELGVASRTEAVARAYESLR